MTREETIKWLESLKAEIGKSEHRTLWHYAEAIDMAIEALTEPINCIKCKHYYETEDDTYVHGHCRMDTAHTDLISRADAIDVVAEEWLSEASAESPYVNDYDIDKYRELAEALFEDVPSAETHEIRTETHGVCLISKDDAIEEISKGVWNVHELVDRIKALPSADALLKQEIDFHKEVSRIEAEKVVDLEHKLANAVQGDECDHCVYKWGMKGGAE